MVKAAQRVLFDIRRDLFSHLQTLPLRFFDTRRHGDVMSYFTNDVDTISDALNNSFAMVIQSFIQMAGTLLILFILNWQLSLIVTVCYGAMFLYIRFSGKRSKAYYTMQQKSLGELDGYIEEMVNGQKVVKVFNHEEENMQAPGEKRGAQKSGNRRPGLCRHNDPRGGEHFLYQLCHCGHFGRCYGLTGHDGCRKPGQLFGVCPAGRRADQSIHPAGKFSAGRPGRRGAGIRGHGPAAGKDEGKVERVHVEADGAEEQWAWRREDGTLVPLRGDVRFREVYFGYDSGHPILKDISLYAKPGQKLHL